MLRVYPSCSAAVYVGQAARHDGPYRCDSVVMMRVLALDTTTRAGSVALVDDDRIVDERRGDATRTHAERLPGEILALRRRAPARARATSISSPSPRARIVHRPADRHRDDPGAGVRARRAGSSASRRSRRWRTSASGDAPPGALIAAWMDAHRRDVFAALYRVDGRARRSARSGSSRSKGRPSADPAATLARWAARLDGLPARVRRRRRGAVRGRDRRRGARRARSSAPPLLAGAIGRLARRAPRGRAVEPGGGPAAVRPAARRRNRARRRMRLRRSTLRHTEARGHRTAHVAGADRRRARHRGGVVHESVDARDVPGRAREPRRVVLLPARKDDDGRAVGFCSFWRVVDELHINNLAVLPEYRRRGHRRRRC